MDHHHLPLLAAASTPPPRVRRVLDAYKTALATAAYAVMARSVARELFPEELRAAARWGVALVRSTFFGEEEERRRNTVVIRRQFEPMYGADSQLIDMARAYLAARIDPRAARRLCLVRTRATEHDMNPRSRGSGRSDGSSSSWSTLLCLEPGNSTTDVFEGVEFMWTCVEAGSEGNRRNNDGESLELSFGAEHTDTALERYVPFVMSTAEDIKRRDRALRIFMNEGTMWHGIDHHHPATFGTLAMDPALKQSIAADLDRFMKRKDYYRRIGKAWKRGYLLYGPPGTGKSSLIAAMANYLRFDLYDLDLSEVRHNSDLQRLLVYTSNKCILVIEDIDCCCDAAASRDDRKTPNLSNGGGPPVKTHMPPPFPPQPEGITLSGLLNFIDGLWSTSGEERIIVFTTNYKDRLDPALLRPGRMDMHVYMGYCGWEAFKTLARNYFLIDDHPLFPEIQALLAAVEVTPAEVSEMLLRSDDADVALRGLVELFMEKRQQRTN